MAFNNETLNVSVKDEGAGILKLPQKPDIGKMVEELDVPFSKAHTATLAALKDLELPIKKDTKKGLKAKFESQYPDGKSVWVNIRAVTESSSKISVRVGIFGDKPRSQKIFDAIHQRL